MADAQTRGLERSNTSVSPLLDVLGVSLRLGNQRVLDDLSFSIGEGSRVALLGPNGAGKSSLLRLISGELAPLTGSISIAGSAAGTAPAQARMGFIPQRISMFPSLTARENLYYFAQLSGLSAKDARHRAGEALTWIDLADRSGDRVGALSGGMQRRLSIACGAVHQPALLIADEPMVGIDAQQRKPVEHLFSDLLEQGTTVLESTHDLRRVLQTFDEIVVLNRGKLIASGSAASLLPVISTLPHRCRITVAPSERLRSFAYDGFRVTETAVIGKVTRPAKELSHVLAAVERHGLQIQDVKVEPPGIDDYLVQLRRQDEGDSMCDS